MFGYIIPDKPELKIKEYELFRAYYCGLCKSISKHYGQIPRFALSYDCAFLGLFLSSVYSSDRNICIDKCVTKPFRKIPVILDNSILQYAANANIIFSYYKVKDDLKDNKKYKAVPLVPLFYPAYLRARRNVLSLDQYASLYLSELTALEDQRCNSIDAATQPFANLLAKAFSCEALFDDIKTRRVLADFGYNIGKWLYTIDALDDIAEDIKDNSYNPIVEQFHNSNETPAEFKERIKDDVGFVLNYSLKKACVAYESLEIMNNKAIIDNIIYGGMYKRTNEILNKEMEL